MALEEYILNYCLESIRSALLFQAEELWTRAIECAVNLPEVDESQSLQQSSASSSTTSLAPMLLADKLGTVSLVYFDRKLFFKSLTRMLTVLGLVALTVAILVGSRSVGKKAVETPSSAEETKQAALIEAQFSHYLYRKLKMEDSVPEGMIQISGQLAELDGRVSGMIGKIQSIRRYMQEDQLYVEDK